MQTLPLFDPPSRSFYLFGPRGTGKSTWVLCEHPEALRIDLLQPEQFRSFQARPERLRERVHAADKSNVRVIVGHRGQAKEKTPTQ
jgi:hypothetical protein